MRSVILKGVKKLEVGEIAEPVKDGENVLIDVKKSGICGSDIHNWDLGAPEGLVLGHEFAGVVTDPGFRADLKVGDRVTALPISPCGTCPACVKGNPQYCRETWSKAVGLSLENIGGLAPKLKVRPDMVLKLPDTVSDDEGAMVEPTAVGLHAVHLADIKIGDKVLVIGAGVIGLLSAMFAKKEGASLVAVSETNMNRAKRAIELEVADKYYDAKNPEMMNELMSDTMGGFDVVIECCGNDAAVTSAIMATRPGGTIVLVGVATGAITIPTVVSVMSELTIKGAIAYTKEEFSTCIDLIANKQIDVTKFVDDIVGLDEVQASYERLTSGSDPAIKILVDPNK